MKNSPLAVSAFIAGASLATAASATDLMGQEVSVSGISNPNFAFSWNGHVEFFTPTTAVVGAGKEFSGAILGNVDDYGVHYDFEFDFTIDVGVEAGETTVRFAIGPQKGDFENAAWGNLWDNFFYVTLDLPGVDPLYTSSQDRGGGYFNTSQAGDYFTIGAHSLFDGGSTIYREGAPFYKPPVPEPSSWALMLAGFGIVGGAMRRRQRTAVSFA